MEQTLLRNKKAEKLLSIWWFLVIIVVFGAIVAGVYLFFSTDIDIREAESAILSDRISNCLASNGYLEEEFLEEDFDLFEYCGLDENVLDSSKFFVKVEIFNETGNEIKKFESGAKALEADCKIWLDPEIEAKEYPRCVEKEFGIIYLSEKNKETGKIKIMAVSNQKGRRTN